MAVVVETLLSLIEQTVDLRAAPGGYVGLCPFHAEKTPSFHVSPDRGVWHCFGCGRGGDAQDFVRMIRTGRTGA